MKRSRKLGLPPYSNTGVQNTPTPQVSICIDWLEFTISYDFFSDFESVVDVILQLDPFSFQQQKTGGNGYEYRFYDPISEITVLFGTRRDMGIHVRMTGNALRLYAVDNDVVSLLQRLVSVHARFSRVDMALDDKTKKFFTVDYLEQCVKNGLTVTKWNKCNPVHPFNMSDGSCIEKTLYFGSMKSSIYMRVYDKGIEQNYKNKNTDYSDGDWIRWEIVFRSKHADQLIMRLIESDYDFTVFSGILLSYFKVVQNTGDSNRSRLPLHPLYAELLNYASKVKLFFDRPVKSVERAMSWIDSQVMPTLAGIYKYSQIMGFDFVFSSIRNCIESEKFRVFA